MAKRVEEVTFNRDDGNGGKSEFKMTFTQFGPKEGVRLGIRVGKLIGAPIGKIFAGIKKIGDSGSPMDDLDFDFSEIGPAVEKLFDNIDEDQALDTIERLLTPVLWNGSPLKWGSGCFEGDPLFVAVIAKKSAEVNFTDFFVVASGVKEKLAKVLSTIQAKQKSTGGSGDQ